MKASARSRTQKFITTEEYNKLLREIRKSKKAQVQSSASDIMKPQHIR